MVWRAFELNPDMPREGVSRREYRTRKFGSWERSQALDACVEQAAAAEGLPIEFARMGRTPNTFNAHRLIWLAGQEGLQDAVVARLFRAYFAEGLDVGDPLVLARIAVDAGLYAERVRRLFQREEGTAEVRREEEEARWIGIDSVPTFIVNGRYAIPGAQPPEILTSLLRQVPDEQFVEQ